MTSQRKSLLQFVCALALLVLFGMGCGGAGGYSKSAETSAGSYAPQAPAVDVAEGSGLSYEVDTLDMERNEVAQVSGGAPPRQPAAPGQPAGPAPPPPQRPDAAPQPPEPSPAIGGADTSPQKVAAPLLIYRADINMAVFESRETISRTEKLARELDGYLVRRSDREIVIRVPAAKFREAMSKIGGFGDVLSQNVNVEDVTERFFDLQVRLKNAKAMRNRFEQLLTKAQTVEDSLKIERELERVTTQIEVLEGKLKLMRELIAFSTITLRLEPRGSDQVTPKVNLPFEWLRQLGLPSLLSM